MTPRHFSLIGSTALILTLGAMPAMAQQQQGFSPTTRQDVLDATERLYAQARNAIESGQYDKALAQLNTLIARFDGSPAFKDPSNRVDAALYWKAYSEAKQRMTSDALDTVRELKDKFANSTWIKDAMALALEVQQSAGQTISPDQPDEDLKLLALRGLMQSDPDRGIPMVEQLLAGNSSMKVKERAIFVLSQSRSARAQEILGRVARDNAQPDLQLKAIRYLGAMRGQDSGRILEEAYRSSTDERIKRSIIRSYMAAGDRGHLIAIAADATGSIALRGEAIRQLGVLRADEELARIYARESSPELKHRAVEGLFVANNAARLVELARAEKDPGLKRDIVQKLSLMRSKEATDYMMELLK